MFGSSGRRNKARHVGNVHSYGHTQLAHRVRTYEDLGY